MLEALAVSELVSHARNARTHTPAQVAQIVASVRAFGWTAPVLVDEQRRIIAGHGRVLAAKEMGLDAVPCVILSGDWTDAQRRAYIIADNKLALNAGWDFAMLSSELQELDAGDFDVTLTGFTAAEMEQIATWTLGEKPDEGKDAGGGGSLFQILIECTNEQAQVETLQKLIDQGIECRALVR